VIENIGRLTVSADDYAGNTSTAGVLNVGGSITGNIESTQDADWFRVTLTAGRSYQFDLQASATGQGTLPNPFLWLRDSSGNYISFDSDGGTGNDARITFAPIASGTYYLTAASDVYSDLGTYKLSATDLGAGGDDYAGNTSTAGALNVGGSITGNIESTQDADWFRVTLTAGRTYQFDLQASATGQGTLPNPFLWLRDSSGNYISFDSDGGTGNEARITFAPIASGTYYLAAASDVYSDLGTYKLSATDTTALTNHAPVVSASDINATKGQSLAATNLFSVTDADHHVITSYQFYDNTPGGTSGHFVVNGVVQPAWNPIDVTAAQFGQTTFEAGVSGSSDDLWVRAFDGIDWSAWKEFHVTIPPNHAPTTTVSNHSVHINEWANIAGWISFTDADNDAATQYQFWYGDTSPSAAKLWTPDSGYHPALNNLTVSAADLGNVWAGGATAAGSETMWVRAFDGLDWSNWTSFTLTTEPNHPPVATIDDHSIQINGWSTIASWISYSDVDNNAATQYQFWYGDTSPSAAKIWTPASGYHPALNNLTVSAADVVNVWVGGGTAPGTETMWVRAFDGINWSNWDSFQLTMHV
jgi:hypothetical protein